VVVEQVAYQRRATSVNTEDEYRLARNYEGVLDLDRGEDRRAGRLGKGPNGQGPSRGGLAHGVQIRDAWPLQLPVELLLKIDDIQGIASQGRWLGRYGYVPGYSLTDLAACQQRSRGPDPQRLSVREI